MAQQPPEVIDMLDSEDGSKENGSEPLPPNATAAQMGLVRVLMPVGAPLQEGSRFRAVGGFEGVGFEQAREGEMHHPCRRVTAWAGAPAPRLFWQLHGFITQEPAQVLPRGSCTPAVARSAQP